jgi:hypothetical protein
MGMFDNIVCQLPLPTTLEAIDMGVDLNDCEIQTKSLENLLDLYTINEEGELILKEVIREWVDDDDAFLKGYLQEKSHSFKKIDYHGILNFYIYEEIPFNDRYFNVFIEYNAKFTDGILKNIDVEDYKIEDRTEEVKEREEFFNNIHSDRKKWYNQYIFNTLPVMYLRKAIKSFFYKVHNYSGKLYYFIIKYI